MQKKIALLISLGFALGLAWFFLSRSPEPSSEAPPSQAPVTSNLPTQEKPKTSLPSAQAPVQAAPVDAFHSFLREEGKRLDSTHVAVDETEKSLREQAEKMGPKEIADAKAVALDLSQPANERILATFLLGKTKSWSELKELVLSPLDRKPSEPHSVDEASAMRELALRYMQIDQLAEGAASSSVLLADFERLTASMRDPGLRKHMERRLAELKAR